MKNQLNETKKYSDVFQSAAENKKLKIGAWLLAAFIGVATISNFVVPEKADALPKPQCRHSVCV